MLSALSYKEEREEYVFDSNFESGNLDFVGKVSDSEYDLLMRLDSNSRSHQQWFYFSVDCKDIKKRTTKGETIKINIMNFTKPNSLYNQVSANESDTCTGNATSGVVEDEMHARGSRLA